MIEITLKLLYLGAPLLLPAIAQGLCMKYDLLNWLKKPIDFGVVFRGKRILGDNKTWRGFVINVLFCVLGTLIQTGLQNRGIVPPWLLMIDYTVSGPLLGALLGMGMTAGELPNSFIKRQFSVQPGKKKKGGAGIIFFLFDQVDIAIGIWIFIYFLIKPSMFLIVYSLLLTLTLHVSISTLGYLLGMRKTIV